VNRSADQQIPEGSGKIIFCGDFCLSNGEVPSVSPALQGLFNEADVFCLNFEGPVVNGEEAAPKAGPSIRQFDKGINACKKWGVTHFTLANNHIMDYGPQGLQQTLEMAGDENIKCLGAGLSFDQAYAPSEIIIKGYRVALFAFSEAQFGMANEEHASAGCAWFNHPRARSVIREAKANFDFVIVQAHAGLEMVQLPLPELRSLYKEFISLGADLVIGHHPHVVQGSEEYKGKMIHYSLGNFYMDVMLRQKNPGSGGVLLVDIRDGRLSSKFIPTKASVSMLEFDESDASQQNYLDCCQQLTDDASYYSDIQEICDEFWRDVYSSYYETAIVGIGFRPGLSSIRRFLRMLVSLVVHGRRSERDKMLLLLHNIRIESHRWCVERALSKAERN